MDDRNEEKPLNESCQLSLHVSFDRTGWATHRHVGRNFKSTEDKKSSNNNI